MASSKVQGWRELRRRSPSECPRLFYALDIQDHQLDLHLTDLVAIWRCNLSKSDIVRRAQSQHTSIDPSESTSQLEVLLRKLEQGLESDRNQLTRGGSKTSQLVRLTTKVALPKPLQPLTWTFELVTQTTEELAEQLLRPCLLDASVSRHKLKSLQQIVKDKDHVISRLLEKIEANGTDLSLIFPGITGLKSHRARVTAAEAQKHVPGMAVFDLDGWTQHFENDNPYAVYERRGINNLVGGCERCPKHTSKQHSDWLKHLPESTQMQDELDDNDRGMPAGKTSEKLQVSDDDVETASEDEFERRPTPPHLRNRNVSRQSISPAAAAHDDLKPPPGKRAKLDRTTESATYDEGLRQPRSSKSPPPMRNMDVQERERNSYEGAPEDETETESEKDDPDTKNGSSPLRKSPEPGSSIIKTVSKVRKNIPQGQGVADRTSTRARLSSSSSSPPPSKGSAARRRLGRVGRMGGEPLLSEDITVPLPAVGDGRIRSPDADLPARASKPRRLGRINQKALTQDKKDHSQTKPSGEIRSSDEDTTMKDVSLDVTPSPSMPRSPSPTTSSSRLKLKTAAGEAQNESKSARNRFKLEDEGEGEEEEDGSGWRSGNKAKTNQSSTTTRAEPEPVPEKELTAEEKANRRREELKKKVDAGGGVKKKRKF